jgi:hypothetical protein
MMSERYFVLTTDFTDGTDSAMGCHNSAFIRVIREIRGSSGELMNA